MSGSLTIAGLGPGDPGLRTIAVQRALDHAKQIILRTGIHPGLDDLLADPRTTTCDDLYNVLPSFDDVYNAVVDRVAAAATTVRVVYAVPGNAYFGERTIEPLTRRCLECDIPVNVLASVSAFDVMAQTLRTDFMASSVQLLDATDLHIWLSREPFGGSLLDIVPSRPMLVSQVYSRAIASSVKLALTRILPDEHEVLVVSAAGVTGQEVIVSCPLHDLDHQLVNHLTSVWVPPLPILSATKSSPTLHRIAATLRAPGGCPWDRKQTHASLRGAVIEEAHEVVDAIDENDSDHLAEELGDLLLQVALHAQIAEEAGAFTIEDVYDHVNRKLVRRHPHVFGTANADTPDQVMQTWQNVKAEERRQRGEPTDPPVTSPLDKLPRSMPILTRVTRVLSESAGAQTAQATDGLADRLLNAVEAVIAAGLDPERELERAFRDRSGDGIVND